MSNGKEIFFADEEAAGSKLKRKAKESPFMIAGLGGLVVALGIAAYKFRHRGSMPTSVFLMQTRVAAQGTVVSALTIGVAYHMFNKWILHDGEDE
ncbi:CLUMA_CG019626, isoform A [Clunio marinus]|uniref:CLUMA_CG019626, isoform A n=1 Tax=Clunio marinus TaxID=568069 RepID=A0A1J1J4G3_9DIPT|nr:CLUMA_CG019626, isoform A [Clunio marinus]